MSGGSTVWQKLMASIKKLDGGPHVRVGVFGTEATKAAAHEFGTDDGNIPERSFLRSTFRNNGRELNKITAAVARKMVTEGWEARKALAVLGEWGAAKCKQTIRDGPLPEWEELSEPYATHKLERGKTTMLVDTGQMLNAITYEVKA